jgi:hypothetical protein
MAVLTVRQCGHVTTMGTVVALYFEVATLRTDASC